MSSMQVEEKENQWETGYVVGTDNGPRIKLPNCSIIVCKEYVQIGPGALRRYCNQMMRVDRMQKLVPINPVKCASKCQTIISPQTRYVAYCLNESQHITCAKNIICQECVKKYNLMQYDDPTNKFEIVSKND